jgi:hypothetical protein
MLQGVGEVNGGGSFGGGGGGSNKQDIEWMSGTNMTSEGGRYRGVFVWNHGEATKKKLNGCCGEGACSVARMACTCQCTMRDCNKIIR